MSERLKKVTLYLSDTEHAEVEALAVDEGVSVSAILRARLGLTYKRRGAPAGNMNRRRGADRRERESTEKVAGTNATK